MDTSNINDTIEDSVNETNDNIEPEETEVPEVAEVKQSIITKPSSISQKQQPDQLCNCPLHCDTKIGKEWREKIYKQFGELGDHSLQNQYIQRHIKIKSIAKRLWEDEIVDKKIQRRVTCKYLIPLTGSVKESYSYAKTLNYDSARFALDTNIQENSTKLKTSTNTPKENGINTPEAPAEPQTSDIEMKEVPQCNGTVSNMELDLSVENKTPPNDTAMKENGDIRMELDTTTENQNPQNGSSMPTLLNLITENKTLENGSSTPLNLTTENRTFENGSTLLNLVTENKTLENGSSTPLNLTTENRTFENGSSTPLNLTTESKTFENTFSMPLNTFTQNKTLENTPSTTFNIPTENKNLENVSSTTLNPPTENKHLENGPSTKLEPTTENKNSENGSTTKENISNVNSPASFNDNESINTAEESISELDSTPCLSVKYVDVCQKAFMNMYGITEKRIRWQREKLILRSRYLAEKQKKELEEMDRTLSLARSLGAGCQPLFAFLENSEYKPLAEQLLIAIEDDVMLVNNFFHNQLWKPEDIMNKSMHLSTTLDSCETECD